jgi:CHAT domain-containing protein
MAAEATGEELNRALLSGDHDVIHFAGHAHFNGKEPDLSGLLLHDQEVFLSQKIQRFVEGQPLVFLNACETGVTANESAGPQTVGEYFWEPAEGLASAFLYGGALGCVGSLWPVYDQPAAEFAVTFYNEVLEGQMVGEAMRLARRSIKQQYPDSITWASFVLYGDPTFQLVA